MLVAVDSASQDFLENKTKQNTKKVDYFIFDKFNIFLIGERIASLY